MNFETIWVEEFSSELESVETVLIDVRTPQELRIYGVISDVQMHIVFWSVDFEQEILALDRSQKYLIYCWHGHRSETIRNFMQANDFFWVKDLKGGIDLWNLTQK